MPRPSDIPNKIIKQNAGVFSDFLSSNFNHCIASSIFPCILKLANVTPVHKKDSKLSKENYRPISILPNLSKVYEKILYKQISIFFDKILSKFQTGFRKGFSTQHCLIRLIEKW